MSKYDSGETPSLMRTLRDILRRLHVLETANPLQNSSFSGGNLRVLDGSDIEIDGGRLVLKQNDTSIVVFGDLFGDGTVGGWVFRRDNGTVAATLPLLYGTDTGTSFQAWQWDDQSGNVLLAEDGVSGNALARPYLAQTLGSTDMATWPKTASGDWTDLWVGYVTRTHPRLQLLAQTYADGSATGEFRVLVDGVQLSTTRTVANGTAALFYDGGVVPVGGNMTQHLVSIQAHVTSGTGAVHVGFFGMQGLQS